MKIVIIPYFESMFWPKSAIEVINVSTHFTKSFIFSLLMLILESCVPHNHLSFRAATQFSK